MNIVQVRALRIGEGIPKICVPIVGRTREEILFQAAEIKKAEPDLVEWRADWYGNVDEEKDFRSILEALRENLGELPLLVTFRTASEGGEREPDSTSYERFLLRVLAAGGADLIDIQLFMGEGLFERVIKAAHRAGTAVVASVHDFSATPPKDEIIKRLCRMQELGADLLKIAVMPHSPEDVLTLLYATREMKAHYARQPLVTMSMGGLGAVSRFSGEIFGSAVTFGSAGKASAPGQIAAGELKGILRMVHEGLGSVKAVS